MTEKEILRCKKNLLRYALRRSKKKGREFSLTLADIHIPSHCPVIGIELCAGGDPKNSPSIERLNRSRGYTPDNILIISYTANVIRHLASSKEIQQVADFFKNYEGTVISS